MNRFVLLSLIVAFICSFFLPKSSLDKKIEEKFEEWCDAIPPRTLKYFYLFPFFAGIFVSIGLTSLIVFALYTRLFLKHLASLPIFLLFLGFTMWATREMYIAFRDINSVDVKPKAT